MKSTLTTDEIVERYINGETLQQIADEAGGVSREAIRQRLGRAGITADQGGRAVMARQREAEALAKAMVEEQKRCWQIFGCSVEEYDAIRGDGFYGDSPIHKYIQQKANAKQHGIDWKLSLTEWWNIWDASGRWEKRGRGEGKYAMYRKNINGPYSRNNVRIEAFRGSSIETGDASWLYGSSYGRDPLQLLMRDEKLDK